MYKIIGADQKEYGPITADQIVQWIAEGRAAGHTQARAEGTEEWKPLSSFPEFASALGIAPAPVTPGVNAPPLPFTPAGGQGAALEAVKGPAIALKVTAIIGLVLVAIGLVINILGLAGIHIPNQQQLSDPQMQRMQKMMNSVGGGVGIVQSFVGAAIGVVVLLGAGKMQRLENYQFALTASILAMLPCLSPCCLLGLPFGIWALVVLNKPEVKSQFT